MYLKIAPVCDCGYVFNEFSMSKEILETTREKTDRVPFLIPQYNINPRICPKCHKEIEGIMWIEENGYFKYDKERLNDL